MYARGQRVHERTACAREDSACAREQRVREMTAYARDDSVCVR